MEILSGILVFGFMALFALALFAMWLWALVHAIRNPALTDGMRLVWVVVIIFLHLLGALLYLVLAPGGHDEAGA